MAPVRTRACLTLRLARPRAREVSDAIDIIVSNRGDGMRRRLGTQTISVPAAVTVTEIAPTTTKLSPGAMVTIPTHRQANGTLAASIVMLAGDAGRKR
jgi:hypothetical protein